MLILCKQTDYARSDLAPMLASVLRDTGLLERLRERGPRVLLKPNFVMPAPPHDASTTHPDFYMSLAHVLRAEGFSVGIGESPAFGSCAGALRAHGVLDECREHGFAIVEFRQPRTYAGLASDRAYRVLSIAAELDAWDSLVNVPKLKTHKQFVFTGATKNLYGCVTGKRKFVRHNLCGNDPVRFARMIVANARAAGCVAHIADGIEALHVNGPRGGVPYPLGAVLASDDPLTLDWAFCRLVALAPERTPLFQALSDDERAGIAAEAEAVVGACTPATDFVHARRIHISFSPWAVARSFSRTLRHGLGLPVAP